VWRPRLPVSLYTWQFWRIRRGRAAESSAREFDALLQRALFAILDHDPETAERALTDAVRVDSDAIDAYIALCRFYRSRGEVGRAIRLHQNLLLRKDLDAAERVKVLLELAQDFHAGGFLRRAVASFEEVISHEPRHSIALAALVELLADLQDFPRSIILERRLAKIQGRDRTGEASMCVRMGEHEREEGRANSARKAAKMAVRRDSRCARAYILLGQLEADRGRDKLALAAWAKVPTLDRELAVEVYPMIEAAYAATNRARDFEGFLRAQVEEQLGDDGATLALSRYLTSRGDSDLALIELKRLLDRSPKNISARAVLGRSLLAAGREEDALREYSSLLDLIEREPRRIKDEEGLD
jgi:lipopolysaccharide biosynthesis regulator YciM